MNAFFRAAFAATALFAATIGARADAAITTTLNFQALAPIRSGVVAYRDAVGGGGGLENSFSVPAGFGSTSLFERDTPLGQLVAIGVSDGVIAQSARSLVAATPHLIVGLSGSYARQEFGSAFGEFDESSIIDALTTLSSGFDGDDPRVKAAYAVVGNFTGSLLDRSLGFGPNAGFLLTSFSVGTPFGTGQSVSVNSAVPEPASWALLIGGIGVTGGALRRRRVAVLLPARA